MAVNCQSCVYRNIKIIYHWPEFIRCFLYSHFYDQLFCGPTDGFGINRNGLAVGTA